MISTLRLQQFRSYGDESFEFEPAVNIVVGPNASGKTNLLEAILVLASGGSYRGHDQDLISFGHDWARLDGIFNGQERTLKLRKGDNDYIGKEYQVDGSVYRRPRLANLLPVVLFEPNHLQLLSRGPETRRDYFDDLLEQTVPAFKTLRNHYRRALAQRNSLLKQSPSAAKDQLFFWNIRFADLAGGIVAERRALLDKINQVISGSYSSIANKKSEVNLKYSSSIGAEDYRSKLLSKLEKTVSTDIARGFTTTGPHRDDIIFELNGQPAGTTASRGESRTTLLALKIFELDLVEQARGQKPILLLDDVFSELDGSRRRYLVAHLKNHQSFITTTDADAVIKNFTTGHKLIPLG